jgi:hypothetical protein
LVPGGVISLQYVADTILFVEKDVSYARNLKCILTCFELMSGTGINYRKNELVPINLESKDEIISFANIFGCSVGTLPIKYLGIPPPPPPALS